EDLSPPPSLNEEVFKWIPILFTLSSHSFGTFSNLSASIEIGRISFSANQCVISFICCCCSDNSNEIILREPPSLLRSIAHRVVSGNHVPGHTGKLVPQHHAPIFLQENPEQIRGHQAFALRNRLHNVLNDAPGTVHVKHTLRLPDLHHLLLKQPARQDG